MSLLCYNFIFNAKNTGQLLVAPRTVVLLLLQVPFSALAILASSIYSLSIVFIPIVVSYSFSATLRSCPHCPMDTTAVQCIPRPMEKYLLGAAAPSNHANPFLGPSL